MKVTLENNGSKRETLSGVACLIRILGSLSIVCVGRIVAHVLRRSK